MLAGGFTAGIAGVGEIAGPLGQIFPTASPGYGYAAIIVAFVGRLNPIGILFAGLLMSFLYLSGDSAQMSLGLPSSVAGLFQGTMLFLLLAIDVFDPLPPARRRPRSSPAPAQTCRCLRRLPSRPPHDRHGAAGILVATIVAGTPIVYAALGELVTERSGVLNLGVEGMMLSGAVSASSPRLSPAASGSGSSSRCWRAPCSPFCSACWRSVSRPTRWRSGLALAIFGTGLSSFIGKTYVGQAVVLEPSRAERRRSPRSRFVGPVARPVPSAGVALLGAVRRRSGISSIARAAGLVLRAVGESPRSAYAIGYKVVRIRYLATCSAARWRASAAPISRWSTPRSGPRGWSPAAAGSRSALVVFATWRPGRCLAGRLSVRRRHDRAAVRAGRGRARADRADVGAALHRDHRRSCPDLPRRRAHPSQRAGVAGQTVPCRKLNRAVPMSGTFI